MSTSQAASRWKFTELEKFVAGVIALLRPSALPSFTKNSLAGVKIGDTQPSFTSYLHKTQTGQVGCEAQAKHGV
jgi:hypothetical protein